MNKKRPSARIKKTMLEMIMRKVGSRIEVNQFPLLCTSPPTYQLQFRAIRRETRSRCSTISFFDDSNSEYCNPPIDSNTVIDTFGFQVSEVFCSLYGHDGSFVTSFRDGRNGTIGIRSDFNHFISSEIVPAVPSLTQYSSDDLH